MRKLLNSLLIAFIASLASNACSAIQASETSPAHRRVEEVPLNAQEIDQIEQSAFRGRLPTSQQKERSLPLERLHELRILSSEIDVLYGASEVPKDELEKYADKWLEHTLKELKIEATSKTDSPSIKIHGTISNSKSEIHLLVIDYLISPRQPNRLYRTIIFSASETKGSPKTMIDFAINKFLGCWRMANNGKSDKDYWYPNLNGNIHIHGSD